MMRNVMTRASRGLAVAAVVAALSVTPSAVNVAVPVLGGLDSPRGLAAGPAGRLMYGEITGAVSELIAHGRNAGSTKLVGSVPPTFIAPQVATDGGQTFVLTAAGEPGSGAATLYKVNPGMVRALADIAAYQVTDPDPYNLSGPVDESNPFGLAPLNDGSVLVADAAANDLLRVYPNGDIETVARLKPRVVAVPPGLGFGPPPGAMIPAEAVATSVTVGADGYYYVGELRGFPSPLGRSQVWRIAPNSVNAVCDPVAPNVGPCQRYADGFTSIVDLDAGRDGSIYVVQLVNAGWLQWEEVPGTSPVGAVYRIPPGGGAPVQLAPGELILPAGIAVTGDNAVYVTAPVFGPGRIVRVQ